MKKDMFETFKNGVTNHQLIVHLDEGLHRHITMKKPNSIDMHYHINTWPGYLCISGDMGVAQNRIRLFIVCTKSQSPLYLDLPKLDHKPAASFIDLDAGNWSLIEKPGRSKATLRRVQNGREQFGNQFVMSYYGNTHSGRDINRPIGTITTRDRWAIVRGDRMRMLTADENMRAMSFPAETKRPNNHRLTVHMAGNAVPPVAAMQIIKALERAA